MEEHDQRPRVGPFRLVRLLARSRHGPRWVAVDERDQTTHVLHEFGLSHDRAERRRFLAAMESLSSLEHPHLLAVKTFSLGSGLGTGAWAVTPYTGHQDGLVTLEGLARAKGGTLSPVETERAMLHLLEAVEYAHAQGHHHGPIGADEVLVDRRGSLLVEMYGLARRMAGLSAGNAELIRDEVRSIVEIGYRLLTGLAADEPRIAAGRLVRRLEPLWDEWLETGLDPSGGFANATEAREALPSVAREAGRRERGGAVRVVFSRFRRVIGSA